MPTPRPAKKKSSGIEITRTSTMTVATDPRAIVSRLSGTAAGCWTPTSRRTTTMTTAMPRKNTTLPPIPVSQPVTETWHALTRARVPAGERRDGENDAREQPEAVADAEEPALEERIAPDISIWKAHRLHSMEHRAEGVAPLHFRRGTTDA